MSIGTGIKESMEPILRTSTFDLAHCLIMALEDTQDLLIWCVSNGIKTREGLSGLGEEGLV